MTEVRTKVLGVGMGKTGTTTLCVCLRKLGYRHLTWRRGTYERLLLERDTAEMHRLMDEYDSFDDSPWCSLYREMDERYPDAKYVLTRRRSPEAWFGSLVSHHARSTEGHLANPAVPLHKYGTTRPLEDPARTMAVYENHNRAVREYFADRPGKLLEVCWEEGDGWKELCGFLGTDIPDLPFPHANKRPDNMLRWHLKKVLRRYAKGAKRRLGLS